MDVYLKDNMFPALAYEDLTENQIRFMVNNMSYLLFNLKTFAWKHAYANILMCFLQQCTMDEGVVICMKAKWK